MLNNQTIFFFFFLTYGVGLFCFPLLKKGISSRLYTVSNFFLLLLQSIGLIFNGFSVSLGESSFTLIAHSLTTFTDIIVGGFVLSITPLSFYFSLLVLLIGCATNLYILSYFRNEADEMSFVF